METDYVFWDSLEEDIQTFFKKSRFRFMFFLKKKKQMLRIRLQMLLFVIFLVYFTVSEDQEQPVDLRVAIVVLDVRVIILSRIKSMRVD